MVKKTKYSKEDNIYLEVKQSIQEIKKIWTTIRRFDRTISRVATLQYQFERLFGTTGIEATTMAVNTATKTQQALNFFSDMQKEVNKYQTMFKDVLSTRQRVDLGLNIERMMKKQYEKDAIKLWKKTVEENKEMSFKGGLFKLGRIAILYSLISQIVNMAMALWEQKILLEMEQKRQSDWFKTKQEISKQVRDQAKDSQSKFRSVVP